MLKKPIFRRNIETLLLLNIQTKSKLAYKDLGDDSAIIDSTTSFFGYAKWWYRSILFTDVVSIKLEEGGNFAIIKQSFVINKRMAFAIIIDLFEVMNQKMLGCPVFKLLTSNWRKVFSINLVNATNTVHFVNICKGEECAGDHDFRNSLYMRNMFFFKAV